MTDPLPPADYESDPYYWAEPADELFEEDPLLDEDLQWWDAEVGYEWETR